MGVKQRNPTLTRQGDGDNPLVTAASRSAPAVDLDKAGDRAVVGALYFGREEAAGEFASPAVIEDTIAAFALPRAGLIGTGTLSQVSVDLTFHSGLR
jgi:hypothetical protein